MPPTLSNKQEERVHEKRIRPQPPKDDKQLKPQTVRQRESLKHRRERGETPHKQTGPVVSGRQLRRRPKHGENKWWRELGLSPQHTSLVNSRGSSTYSDSSATSSENGSSEWPTTQPSTPWYRTPTPYKGHIPKIMVTDAEPSPAALDPCMQPNKDYEKHMQSLSNSTPTLSNSMPSLSSCMPTLFSAEKKQQQRRVNPKSPRWQPSPHSSDYLVKLPELRVSNCQMTRSSSCDLPSKKTLPKLPRSLYF